MALSPLGNPRSVNPAGPPGPRQRWVCLCGGNAYDRDQLVAMSEPDPEGIGWADYWRSILGPDDLYCSEEDDVLTEMEAWQARGLKLPVHDDDWALGGNSDVWDGIGNPAEELIW